MVKGTLWSPECGLQFEQQSTKCRDCGGVERERKEESRLRKGRVQKGSVDEDLCERFSSGVM